MNSLAASSGCRKLATERTNYISVTSEPEFEGSVALIKMQKKPVNSICSNFCRELIKTVDDLENNENMRAMIITSALPGVFSAGLDFNFLLGATRDDVYNFWRVLQDTTLKLYGSRLITIAAVNGHCMAGGNLLALAADYRVMAESNKISLNETKLGVYVPFYLRQMLENLIGPKATARAVQLSLVFTSAEACKIGWVEEVTPLDQVMTAAKRELKQWLEIPDSGRTLMKMDIRRKEIQEIIDRREEDAEAFASLISRPGIQEQLIVSINKSKKN